MTCWLLADKGVRRLLEHIAGVRDLLEDSWSQILFLKVRQSYMYNIQLPRNIPDGLLGPSSKMLATLLMKSGILALKALLGGPGGCVDNSRRVPGVLQLRPELSNSSPVDQKKL